MIIKTQGIALRIFPYSKTSHVISWFTPDYGKITTLVKGAQRLKSGFIGQVDLFYRCEILFYEKEHQHLHILKECSPLTDRRFLRRSWKRCLVASYFCDLIWRICPPSAHHPGLFETIDEGLNGLEKTRRVESLFFWFELQVLTQLGLKPRLAHCPLCGSGVLLHSTPSVFSAEHGGLVCPACAQASPHQVKLSSDAIAVMQAWQQSPNPVIACRTTCSPRQKESISIALRNFIGYHLDTLPDSRHIALDLISRKVPSDR